MIPPKHKELTMETNYRTDLPWVMYGRVSRVGGRKGEGYISPREQERVTRALGAMHGLTVMDDFLIDEDASGGTLERVKFQRALDLIRNGQAAGMIVKAYDRFSRDVVDGLATIREIEAIGGRIVCGDGPATLQGDGAMMTVMRAMIASEERRKRGEDLRASVVEANRRGIHLATPYGYAKGTDKRLVVNELEGPWVKTLFKLRTEGRSLPQIAAHLNQHGAPLRTGYKRHGKDASATTWTWKAVDRILGNKVYLGIAHEGDLEKRDAHPVLIDPEVYELANRTRTTRKRGNGYLLTGLVRCAGCGHAMAVCKVHGDKYRVYRCQRAKEGCPAPCSINADQLEPLVWEDFKARYLGKFVPSTDDAELQAAEAARDQAKRYVGGTMAMVANLGDVSPTERELAEDQLSTARRSLKEAELDLRRAQMAARGADLPEDLTAEDCEDAPMDEKRHWLARVFRAVVVRRGEGYREPVGPRTTILLVDDAPAQSTHLIDWIAALRDVAPAGAGVLAS
jgi:DNA invertase Pin-like site-specific DNA recombinase